MGNQKETEEHIIRWGRIFRKPLNATDLSTLYAGDIYEVLGFRPAKTAGYATSLSPEEAELLGKAVLHTAMNACLKHSKAGGQDNGN